MSAGVHASTLFAVSHPIDWSLSMIHWSISLLNSLSNTSSSSSCSLQTSISLPTSIPASLMLHPPFPIPFLTSSGCIYTLIFSFSPPITTEDIFAGFKALWMSSWVFEVHWRTSMFSLRSSRTIPMIREPLTPMQAPIGSILSSYDSTATLARSPGTRTTFLIVIRPSYISGTSCSNSFSRNSFDVLESTM